MKDKQLNNLRIRFRLNPDDVLKRLDALGDKQKKIMRMLLKNQNGQQVADILGVSRQAVNQQKQAAFRRLGL